MRLGGADPPGTARDDRRGGAMLELVLTAIQIVLALVALPIVVLCAFFPVVLFFSVCDEVRFRRFLTRAAAACPCPECGARLGSSAPAAAVAARCAYMTEFHRRFPDRKYPSIRRFDALCPTCGAQLRYHRESQRFQSADDEGDG